MQLFTIGHSAHPIDKFIGLLHLHQIQLVIDVRSVPVSRFHPQFGKQKLAAALNEHQIGYLFLGKTLGGRPADPTCYPNGVIPVHAKKPWPRADYVKVMSRTWFIQGIHQVLSYLKEQTTTILCSEENPANCHRHLLIAEYLRQQHPDVDILHIRGNGAAETTITIQEELEL